MEGYPELEIQGPIKKLRLNELYTSIQGEGPNVGKPVQFVRFAGCNMRCPSWPCDSQHAIDPHLYMAEGGSEKLDAKELFAKLAPWPRALVLTGGEPFLQPEVQLREFVQLARGEGYTIEAFTNGTQMVFPQWASSAMTFVLDLKLFGSGEQVIDKEWTTRMQNIHLLRRYDTIKFTVASMNDLDEAFGAFRTLRGGSNIEVNWAVGRVWGKEITDKDIVNYVMKNELPWVLNMQLHKYIWDPEARRT